MDTITIVDEINAEGSREKGFRKDRRDAFVGFLNTEAGGVGHWT